jgi:hypothetical protein
VREALGQQFDPMKDILRIACCIAIIQGSIHSMRSNRGPMQEFYHLTLIFSGVAGLVSLEMLRRSDKRRRKAEVSRSEDIATATAVSATPIPQAIAEEP